MHDANLGSKNGFLLKEQRGLTIFELLGVLIILGIIATIIIPTVVGVVDKSEQDADTKTIENVGRIAALWMNQRDANCDGKLDLANDGTSNVKWFFADTINWNGQVDHSPRTSEITTGLVPPIANAGFNPGEGFKDANFAVMTMLFMKENGLVNEIPKSSNTGQAYLIVYLKCKWNSATQSGYWLLHWLRP